MAKCLCQGWRRWESNDTRPTENALGLRRGSSGEGEWGKGREWETGKRRCISKVERSGSQ